MNDQSIAYSVFIIFLVAAFIFIINGFSFPSIIVGKKDKVVGVIYEIKLVHGIKGALVQEVYYCYEYNDIKYEDYFRPTQIKYGRQKEGDSVVLEISVKNPERNKIIGFKKFKTKK